MKRVVAVLFVLSSSLRAEDTPPSKTDPSADLWRFASSNSADLKDICPMSRFYLKPDPKAFGQSADAMTSQRDIDDKLIAMVLDENADSVPLMTYFIKKTDYYSRRSDVQTTFEQHLRRLKGRSRPKAVAKYAMALLHLGEFERVVSLFGPNASGDLKSTKYWRVDFALAQALFRLGRFEESLIYARKSWQVNPAALDTRWQMMLSQLGTYGKDFTKKFRMKGYSTSYIRKVFPSDWVDFPFEDVSAEMGISQWGGSGSASFVDFDGDGFEDMFIERKFYPPKIYRNVAGARFEDIGTDKTGTDNCSSILVSPADYDNDGKMDFARNCCNFDGQGPIALLKNMGDMTFKDVSKGSGLDDIEGNGMALAWGDYDLDGNLDLVVADFVRPTRLYRNNGDGTFTNVTGSSGIHTPGRREGDDEADFGAIGAAWGDYDGDGYPDLFTQGWGWKRLYHNNGDGTFSDVTERSGLPATTDFKKGYLGYFVDYDNDGRLDLLVGQYLTISDSKWGFNITCTCSNLLNPKGYSARERDASTVLYRNNGDGTFTENVKFLPLGVMGYAHGDWNNDGYKDFVFGAGGPYLQQVEPYLFYQNNRDGTFTNKTPFAMTGLWGKGHGLAFGDYDHDGQMDLILQNGGFLPGDAWPTRLLRNKGNGNHWVTISLKPGAGVNASAIGAAVRVWAGDLEQLELVRGGGSLGGGGITSVHFGLGRHERVDRIVVEWPDKRRSKTEFTAVDVDQAIEIRQENGTLTHLWGSVAASAKMATK